MNQRHRLIMDNFKKFRKLNVSSMLPGITHSDFRTLMSIENCQSECEKQMEHVKVSMLSQKMHVNSTAVSRSLRALEERGLIQRQVSARDRRNTYVALTKEGKEILQESYHIMDEFFESVFQRLDEDEVTKLINSLNTLYDVAYEELQNRKYNKRESTQTNQDERNTKNE